MGVLFGGRPDKKKSEASQLAMSAHGKTHHPFSDEHVPRYSRILAYLIVVPKTPSPAPLVCEPFRLLCDRVLI